MTPGFYGMQSKGLYEATPSVSLQTCVRIEQILTDPKQVNETFCTFYSNLYHSEIQLDREKCQNILGQVDLPQLAAADSMHLDAPFTLEELKAAALDMQRNKSPGFDRIRVLNQLFWLSVNLAGNFLKLHWIIVKLLNIFCSFSFQCCTLWMVPAPSSHRRLTIETNGNVQPVGAFVLMKIWL